MHRDQALMHLSTSTRYRHTSTRPPVYKPLQKILNDSNGMANSVTWYASTVVGGDSDSSTAVFLSL